MNLAKKIERRVLAKVWLRFALSRGPMRVPELLMEAASAGFNSTDIYRARHGMAFARWNADRKTPGEDWELIKHAA